MDPCPFVRLIIESLAVELPSGARSIAASEVHPSATPCYAKLKLHNFPSQTALLPLAAATPPESSATADGFHLNPEILRSLSLKPTVGLKISVFTGRRASMCGIKCGRLLGSVQVSVDLSQAQENCCLYQNGWMKLSGGDPVARVHVTVRSEPDPRFVFQFGGEPECSPVVFQIQGNIRQPVFSCKFSAGDRNNRSRSLPSDFTATNNRRWLIRTFSGDKNPAGKERKGWMLTVYDLSGSAVAAASMTTPFVPSPAGSDRVSRSNPGAWLILRPLGGSWKPWGRLEAWRERGGPVEGMGYKLELVSGVPIAEGSVSMEKGGKFRIESSTGKLVMESSVGGKGVSRPELQVGMQHVTSTGDAAVFVAVAGAVDLSVDACRLFGERLRKELIGDDGNELLLIH